MAYKPYPNRERLKADMLDAARRHICTSYSALARRFELNRQTIHNWADDDTRWGARLDRALAGENDESIPVPDLATLRRDYFGHDTPRHQAEWAGLIEEHDISLILVPPEHGKTTWVIEYIVDAIIRNRNVRVMYVCSNQVEARKRIAAVQERLSEHEFYESNGFKSVVEDFGPFAPQMGERSKQPWAADFFRVSGAHAGEKDYTMQALGLRGRIYGTRLDLIILDDIVEDWVNDTEQERIISWLLGRVQTRLSRNGKLIIIGTRVHEMDIYSQLLNESSDWAADWAKMVQPAILDEESKTTLWPEYWGYDDLIEKRRKKMRTRDWALIYQQQAVGLPDSPFPLEVLEASKDKSFRVGQVPQGLPVVMGVDPATDGTCAIVVLAIDRKTRRRYIIDCIAKSGLGQREGIKAEIIYAAKRYGAVRCRVEQNFSQLGDDPDLKNKLHTLGCNLEKWVTGPDNKYDKDWGVLATAGRFAEGLFVIPAGPGSDAHMRPMIEELALWRAQSKQKQDRVMGLWFADLSADKMGVFRPGLPRHNPNTPAWARNRRIPGWVRGNREKDTVQWEHNEQGALVPKAG